MDYFDVNTAYIASHSAFDATIQKLTRVELPQDNRYLDGFERELGLGLDNNSDVLPLVQLQGGPSDLQATLQETLKT